MSLAKESFNYPQCKKGGYHVGEIINLVCIESGCKQKCLICGICLEEEHKNHKVRPIKIIFQNSKKYINSIVPMNDDQAIKIKQNIAQSKMNMLKKFQVFQNNIKEIVHTLKNSIQGVYKSMMDQIELKSSANQDLLKFIQQIKLHEVQYDRFTSFMHKLLNAVPQQPLKDKKQLQPKQILESITGIHTRLIKDLEKKQTKVKTQFQLYIKTLTKTMSSSIFQFKNQYKFSSQLHHSGVQVTNDTTIKSIEGNNYHFALMEPSIQSKGNKPQTVSFKINQNQSNWLAIGVCYKNTVQANHFNFNYSTLGHGAYMISSNAGNLNWYTGSWSSIDSSKNNVVTAFNFYTNDIIYVEYDPINTQIIFKKKGTQETHTIQFQVKQDDELYLCGLFYYKNDVIQFLGYDQ